MKTHFSMYVRTCIHTYTLIHTWRCIVVCIHVHTHRHTCFPCMNVHGHIVMLRGHVRRIYTHMQTLNCSLGRNWTRIMHAQNFANRAIATVYAFLNAGCLQYLVWIRKTHSVAQALLTKIRAMEGSGTRSQGFPRSDSCKGSCADTCIVRAVSRAGQRVASQALQTLSDTFNHIRSSKLSSV